MGVGTRAQASYNISSLSSAPYARSLNDRGDINTLFTIAGELEIKGEGTNDDWLEFIAMTEKFSK